MIKGRNPATFFLLCLLCLCCSKVNPPWHHKLSDHLEWTSAPPKTTNEETVSGSLGEGDSCTLWLHLWPPSFPDTWAPGLASAHRRSGAGAWDCFVVASVWCRAALDLCVWCLIIHLWSSFSDPTSQGIQRPRPFHRRRYESQIKQVNELSQCRWLDGRSDQKEQYLFPLFKC